MRWHGAELRDGAPSLAHPICVHTVEPGWALLVSASRLVVSHLECVADARSLAKRRCNTLAKVDILEAGPGPFVTLVNAPVQRGNRRLQADCILANAGRQG